MYNIILTLSNNLNPEVKLTKQQYHTQYKNQDDYEGCFYQWVVGYLRYICIETNVAQQLMTKIINYHSVDVCLRTSENQSDFSVPKHNHVCIFMPTFWLHTKVFYWQLLLKLITIKFLLLLWGIFQPPQIHGQSEYSPYIYIMGGAWV